MSAGARAERPELGLRAGAGARRQQGSGAERVRQSGGRRRSQRLPVRVEPELLDEQQIHVQRGERRDDVRQPLGREREHAHREPGIERGDPKRHPPGAGCTLCASFALEFRLLGKA